MHTTHTTANEPSAKHTAHSARDRRHEQAVIQAEVRRLTRVIGPFGVLSRDALAHVAGAEHWRDGGFDSALRAAVESGRLEPRPFGFYRDASAAITSGRSRRLRR